MKSDVPPEPEPFWEAIVCRGCGRRLYDDNGNPVRTFWQWLNGC